MSEVLTLASFVEAHETQPLELFLLENARPVLLHHSHQQSVADAADFRTALLGASMPQLSYAAPLTPDLPVYPLVKAAGALYSDRIIIGRTSNCDIPLPFASISKFHAYVTWPEDPDAPEGLEQQYWLTDPGSTNGCFIDGRRLELRKPKVIHDGAHILFGEQSFSFLTPATFEQAVARIAAMVR
ncbi:MAG: FHA domain-containing protein [Deltaproteobacteria bacterium]|nr:FHA domain-containing protein [Deltaproteobacteria bacterium]